MYSPSMRVVDRNGRPYKFQIVSGRKADPRKMAEVYNSVLGPLESGMAVTTEQMAARLQRDIRSVLAGFLDGKLCALINVVRRAGMQVPDTHQKLTYEDWFTCVLENGAESWFCPWVAVDKGYRQIGAVVNEKILSLGQLLVRAVKNDAFQDPYIKQLFAYTRPAYIRKFLGRSGTLTESLDPDTGKTKYYLNGNLLELSSWGIRLAGSGENILSMQQYWNEKDPDNEKNKYDHVLGFHAKLGGIFMEDLVKPDGNPEDGLAMHYRTPVMHLKKE